jgi:hypothetical protein
MKKTKFTVVFMDGSELTIWASSAIQAMILGSAEKINLGEVWMVDSVSNTENRAFYTTDKSILQMGLKQIPEVDG